MFVDGRPDGTFGCGLVFDKCADQRLRLTDSACHVNVCEKPVLKKERYGKGLTQRFSMGD